MQSPHLAQSPGGPGPIILTSPELRGDMIPTVTRHFNGRTVPSLFDSPYLSCSGPSVTVDAAIWSRDAPPRHRPRTGRKLAHAYSKFPVLRNSTNKKQGSSILVLAGKDSVNPDSRLKKTESLLKKTRVLGQISCFLRPETYYRVQRS